VLPLLKKQDAKTASRRQATNKTEGLGGPPAVAGRSVDAIPSSFRDPAGYVTREGAIFKRVVTGRGRDDYELYRSSGLHDDLTGQGLIVDYREEKILSGRYLEAHKVLVPEQIPFISYPYEWSFDQLKDAALLTLEIQERALAYGLSLKDASAYNVQFVGSHPVFIDLLSFEKDSGGPWVAYEQFCRHFLGPLLLMQHHDPGINRFLRADLDGFPLGLISRLLPGKTFLNPGALLHIHLHARAQARYAGAQVASGNENQRAGVKSTVLHSLRSAVEKLKAPAADTAWSGYRDSRNHYTEDSLVFKKEHVGNTIRTLRPSLVFDLGANSGEYSEEVSQAGSYCVAMDVDPGCVNRAYLDGKGSGNRKVLPLLMDLRNPSPGAGFGLSERASLLDRPQADFTLVLALLHHLRITAMVPLAQIAAFLSRLTDSALVEFVPKTDPMTRKLLAGRRDTFDDYTVEGLINAFESWFDISHRAGIPGTSRTLWWMRRRNPAAA
jgi:hypothetical protein